MGWGRTKAGIKRCVMTENERGTSVIVRCSVPAFVRTPTVEIYKVLGLHVN